MWRWKKRLIAFMVGLTIGLTAFFVFKAIAGLFHTQRQSVLVQEPAGQPRCISADGFDSPEEILSALKSEDVGVRRDIFKRLFLRPGVSTVYYDYERDSNYPERAERAALQYINLDESGEPEALITFDRILHPVALILKREACGWRLIAALSSWLRFEDYPYTNWLELPETIRPGVHEILVQDSTGDATHYVRKARLLKLMGDSLEQVAEFEEEAIRPLEDYKGADWNDVRNRRTTTHTFLQASQDQPARLQLETIDESVKYSGSPESYTYWLETDGSWHTSRKHWRTRPFTRLKLLGQHAEQLIWDEQRRKFISHESSNNSGAERKQDVESGLQ